MSLRQQLIYSVSGMAFMTAISACSTPPDATAVQTNLAQVGQVAASIQAANIAAAKVACPGVTAIVPIANGGAVAVATAAGQGVPAAAAAQLADTLITTGCAAVTALPDPAAVVTK